ncbi:MAG: exo-alpha-sialidase [Clostridia bacterium]|nr:exo-alpha-sialidase [Clostridia bacterium]
MAEDWKQLDPDLALQPAWMRWDPDEEHKLTARKWQATPSIAMHRGRLWISWNAGISSENVDNYIVVKYSDDLGKSWCESDLIIDLENLRVTDSMLWVDPLDRLWIFWYQTFGWYDGRGGVWASVCETPEAEKPQFSAPRRVFHGMMMTKPIVTSTGRWLLPSNLFQYFNSEYHCYPNERFSNVYTTDDNGETFYKLGKADVPGRLFDEHNLIELSDGRLMMLVRTVYGIGKSYSQDGGRTWSFGEPSWIPSPSSRVSLTKLKSGTPLLVNHYCFTPKSHQYSGRDHLHALLSDDDCMTFHPGIELDERANVSYPDTIQLQDGLILTAYDRDRPGAGELLLATYTEEDLRAGRNVSGRVSLKNIVSALVHP